MIAAGGTHHESCQGGDVPLTGVDRLMDEMSHYRLRLLVSSRNFVRLAPRREWPLHCELDDRPRSVTSTCDATMCRKGFVWRGRRMNEYSLIAQLRQSVFGCLAGHEDVNDADRLGRDPAMRGIVAAGGPVAGLRTTCGASTRASAIRRTAGADRAGSWRRSSGIPASCTRASASS